MRKLTIGFVATYIIDYNFKHISDIPVEAAVEWVKKSCPNANMGLGTLAKDLTVEGEDTHNTNATGNGWLNKLFVVVGVEHTNWIALYNHDGKFSIRTKDIYEE